MVAAARTGYCRDEFYIYAAIKGGSRYVAANKVAVLLLNLWVCFYLYFYIVVLVLVVAMSRIYYANRLKIRYP